MVMKHLGKLMNITLNDDQRDAIKKAINWYYDRNKRNILVICGFAGTGKSTLIQYLITILGLAPYQVIYTSFTGRAVEILRRKNCQANTIHKTFYSVRKINDRIHFKKKTNLSSAIKLVVIDELSMVNDRMMDDILSFNIPIIGLGDHGQLPPIYGANKYIANPDIFLKQIMRQSGDLGILRLATLARSGDDIPFGDYIESRVIRVKDIDNIEKYDIVLCWKNVTRRNLNILIRSILGYTSSYPCSGERLTCLKNNYVHLIEYDDDIPLFLVNGMDLICCNNENEKEDADCITLTYRPPFVKDSYFKTRVHKGPFDAYQTENKYIIEEATDDVVFLDFGNACTVHKSQSTEYDNVLIIDEFKGSTDLYNKWLYTAITRARKSVTIARYI
jgi:exodeoxyribonuclease-5